jgi:hypothetical protein
VNLTVVGIAAGAFLAFMSFAFGVWGFLGSLLFMAVVVGPVGPHVLRRHAESLGRGGPIWDRAVAAKAQILQRVTELSGAQLSRVDIRISGASVSDGGRVR